MCIRDADSFSNNKSGPGIICVCARPVHCVFNFYPLNYAAVAAADGVIIIILAAHNVIWGRRESRDIRIGHAACQQKG
jgi:hypothetical protein